MPELKKPKYIQAKKYMPEEDTGLAENIREGYGKTYGSPVELTGRLAQGGQELGRLVAPAIFRADEMASASPEKRRLMAAGEALGLVMPMQIGPVYHGSPYRFDKFKNEAIGTGEGAQAFGRGHYLTESPEVAKQYAKQVKNMRFVNEINEKLTTLSREMDKHLKPGGGYRDFSSPRGHELAKEYDRLMEEKLTHVRNQGSVYEATLHKGKKPGEYAYLEWEKEIPEKLKTKIIDLLNKEGVNYSENSLFRMSLKDKSFAPKGKYQTGYHFYNNLASVLGGDAQASAFLKRAGIDGIKYPAGSLSGMKSDKFNYVVFDPADIAIDKVK